MHNNQTGQQDSRYIQCQPDLRAAEQPFVITSEKYVDVDMPLRIIEQH
jgi:hypothetical protein